MLRKLTEMFGVFVGMVIASYFVITYPVSIYLFAILSIVLIYKDKDKGKN